MTDYSLQRTEYILFKAWKDSESSEKDSVFKDLLIKELEKIHILVKSKENSRASTIINRIFFIQCTHAENRKKMKWIEDRVKKSNKAWVEDAFSEFLEENTLEKTPIESLKSRWREKYQEYFYKNKS